MSLDLRGQAVGFDLLFTDAVQVLRSLDIASQGTGGRGLGAGVSGKHGGHREHGAKGRACGRGRITGFAARP